MAMMPVDLGLSSSSADQFLAKDFAPKDIPWRRGVKNLGVVVICTLIIIAWPLTCVPILFITLAILHYFQSYGLIALLFSFLIPYIIWMLLLDVDTPHRGARPSKFVRSWDIWKQFNDYFPIKLVKTVELDPSKNYLFGVHPHGLISFGALGCFLSDGNETEKLFPGFKFSLLTFNLSFIVPFLREIYLLLGLCSASRKSMDHLLSRVGGGNIAVLIPGGAAEALDFCPEANILRLKDRKGFIKVAMQNGYGLTEERTSIVPVFSFGENRIYQQVPNPRGSLLRTVQEAFQRRFQLPTPLFYGRGIFQYTLGLLPNRVPVTVDVGGPIPVEKVAHPTQAQIDELHGKYVAALTELFHEHKDKYSTTPNDKLVIT